jgi:hypothetical protein
MRAQTSLPALGFALLLLTGVLVVGIAVADGSLLDADRAALERQAAVDLSDRLVAADSPLTERPNVLNRTVVESLDGAALHTRLGLSNGTGATLTLDGRTLATTGTVTDGTTLTRLVVVQTTVERTLTPDFAAANDVTLPRRTAGATVRIQPAPNATVTAVRANDRVVLHNDSGLSGRFDVSLSPYRTTTLSFESQRLLTPGRVTVTYSPTRTEKARLEVTVDG